MNERKIFGLIVRGVGLVTIIYGLGFFFEGSAFIFGLAERGIAAKYWVTKGLLHMFIGMLMLCGGRPIVNLAFRLDDTAEQVTVEQRKDAEGESNAGSGSSSQPDGTVKK